MIDMINALTIQETILFVGLFIGLLISIGIASIDPTVSRIENGWEVISAILQHVFMQWIIALVIFAIISVWVLLAPIFFSNL